MEDYELQDSDLTWEDHLVIRGMAEGVDRLAAYLVGRYGARGQELAYRICKRMGALEAKRQVLYRLIELRFGFVPARLGIKFDFGRERVLDLMLDRLFLCSTFEEYWDSCLRDAWPLQTARRVLPFGDPLTLP